MADHFSIYDYYRYFSEFGLRPSDVDAFSVEECEMLMCIDDEVS